MRLNLTRDFYIPKQAQVVRSKLSPAVVYLSISRKGNPSAMGFYGKAEKPEFHYTFRTDERRRVYVSQWLKDADERAVRKEARKAEKKAFVHSLKVGDVMSTCWGYDQTNIEYFEVTKLIGKSMVEIREIGQEREETAYMQGKCVPRPGHYISEPMRKRVLEGNSLDIHGGFGYARLEAGQEIAGTKVYGASHWTAYA